MVKVGYEFVDIDGSEWKVDRLIPQGEVFAGEWECTETSTKETGIWTLEQIEQRDGNYVREGESYFAPKALDIQIGGSHYKDMPIQPMEYSMKNGLDACQHTIIKYVTRFREKGGIEDLEKAKHCIDLLIGFEREG